MISDHERERKHYLSALVLVYAPRPDDMTHPSVSEILAATANGDMSAELERHLATCSACRELAGLAGVDETNSDAANDKDLDDLPTINRQLYHGWRELADGRGGMGRTLRARDRRLGREVAIKELLDPRALPPAFRQAARERFEREARLTARLQHPAIVTIYEGGKWDDGEPFYAMPLVRGRPLDDEIEACKTLTERLALLPRITTMAEAIAYAHSEGIVHRDVKPQNVLIGSFGETIVIDWGLATDLRAKEASENSLQDVPDAPDFGFTKLGVGTPSYMPPEQASGSAADPRMDVYALGATLYHALSGSPPYGYGPTNLIREKLRKGPPASLVEIAPDTPPELLAIVGKAMARDPADRFQSARELADELQRFQTGQLTRTHRYTLRDLLRVWMRRHRAVLRVAAAFTMALVLIGILAILRITQERDQAKRELERSRGITASSLAPNPLKRIEALELGIQAVAPRVRAGQPPQPEALQGLMDALSAGPVALRLDVPNGSVLRFRMTPDGSTLVSLGSDGFIRFWDPQTGKQHRRTLRTSTASLYDLQISPDGAWVAACGYQAGAELFDVATGQQRILTGHGAMKRCLFSHDGSSLVTADSAEVVRWDLQTAQPLDRLPLDGDVTEVALSRQGLLAAGCGDGQIWLWNPNTKKRTRLEGHRHEVTSLRFTPDGTSLWSTGIDGQVLRWPVDLDAPVHPTIFADDEGAQARDVDVAPEGQFAHWKIGEPYHWSTTVLDFRHPERQCRIDDGNYFTASITGTEQTRRLVTYSLEGAINLWSVDDCAPLLRIRNPKAMTVLGAVVESMPRQRRLAWAIPGNSLLWDLREGMETGLLLGHTSDIVTTQISPTGDRFVTAGMDGTARLWDLRTGNMLAVIRSPAELVSAAFSPDGARIVTAGLDGIARLFDAEGHALRTLGEASDPLSMALFSPDSTLVLTASFDGTVKVWDAATGQRQQTLDAHDGPVQAAAFSPDGTTVFAGHANQAVHRWNLSTGALEATFASVHPTSEFGVGSLFVSPDGEQVLAAMGGKPSVLLRAKDLSRIAEVEGHAASAAAAPFLTDGRHLLLVDRDGRALMSERGTDHMRVFAGHSQRILSAQMSTDGRHLVTGSMDGTVRVWDVERQATLFTTRALDLGQVTSALFSPDGRSILAAYSSGALRLYPANAERALNRACKLMDDWGKLNEVSRDCP